MAISLSTRLYCDNRDRLLRQGNPFQTGFTFYYMERRNNGKMAKASLTHEKNAASDHPYFDAVKSIGTVQTIEEFWSIYNHLIRPNELSSIDYHFFREGVQPSWEDPQNSKGGKFVVRLPDKALASRYWEEVVLALLGQQFIGIPFDEVCGAVVSVKGNLKCCTLSLWNKTADDSRICSRIRDSLRKILLLPKNVPISYQNHPRS